VSSGDGATLADTLLAGAEGAQLLVLRAGAALGLTDTVAGQPAWPFAHRVAVETLLIDPGLARQLVWALAAGALAVLLALAGALRRRERGPLWGLALLLLLLWPWPPRSLWLTAAVPTSFHRSPTGFDAASVTRGLALYRQHCLACHGADGRGEGPAAATLPVWPPTLSAGLLWKRAEGELLWRVLHGMQDRAGRTTMPPFAGRLVEADAWALLDAMRALSAGEAVRREATWPWPVQAPDFALRCGNGPPRRLAAWRGQRVRIVAGAAGQAAWREDPRLLTVVLQAADIPQPADCVALSPDATAAYALVAGVSGASLAGLQFIVDRDGWLRALAAPGRTGWSEDSLICRASEAPVASAASPQADGLGALIARMDADPVRNPRLFGPHGR